MFLMLILLQQLNYTAHESFNPLNQVYVFNPEALSLVAQLMPKAKF